jgi:hypothetical protein
MHVLLFDIFSKADRPIKVYFLYNNQEYTKK